MCIVRGLTDSENDMDRPTHTGLRGQTLRCHWPGKMRCNCPYCCDDGVQKKYFWRPCLADCLGYTKVHVTRINLAHISRSIQGGETLFREQRDNIFLVALPTIQILPNWATDTPSLGYYQTPRIKFCCEGSLFRFVSVTRFHEIKWSNVRWLLIALACIFQFYEWHISSSPPLDCSR